MDILDSLLNPTQLPKNSGSGSSNSESTRGHGRGTGGNRLASEQAECSAQAPAAPGVQSVSTASAAAETSGQLQNELYASFVSGQGRLLIPRESLRPLSGRVAHHLEQVPVLSCSPEKPRSPGELLTADHNCQRVRDCCAFT